MTFPKQPSSQSRQNPVLAEVSPQDVRDRLSVIFAGKYRILHQLGSGGMATVWLARHRAHGALFAIKVLHPSFSEIPEFQDAFHREALHTALLAGHPNIVPIFDIDHADGLHYLVMPYVRGCDLDEALRRCGKFHIDDVLTIALEIAKTLAFAEDQDILHGDISLGNIRIDSFGRILMLDFGLTRPRNLSINSASDFKMGTPYAMSPERIRGGVPDIRSDLYSFGVLLFHLAAGHPLFAAETIEGMEEQHLHATVSIPDWLRNTHPQFSKLLRNLLEKEPRYRPATARAVENKLRQMGAISKPLEVVPLLGDTQPIVRPRLSSVSE